MQKLDNSGLPLIFTVLLSMYQLSQALMKNCWVFSLELLCACFVCKHVMNYILIPVLLVYLMLICLRAYCLLFYFYSSFSCNHRSHLFAAFSTYLLYYMCYRASIITRCVHCVVHVVAYVASVWQTALSMMHSCHQCLSIMYSIMFHCVISS